MSGKSKKKRAKRAAEAAAQAERVEQVRVQGEIDADGRNFGAELAAKRKAMQYGLGGERGKRGSVGLLGVAKVGKNEEKINTLG